MPTPDIVILIVVLLSALIGLVRGLFAELLSLVTWFTAFVMALFFAPVVAGWLAGYLEDSSIQLMVGFVAIFVATLILGSIAQWLVGKLVETTGLSGTDRFLGFLFGSARGVLVCIIALIAVRPFAEEAQWWAESRLTPELLAFEQDVLELMGKARDVVVEVSEQV